MLFEGVIKGAVFDADPDVRLWARKAFWGYSAHWAEAGKRLVASFDSSTQQRIYEEFKGDGTAGSVGGGQANASPRARPASAAQSQQQRTGAGSQQRGRRRRTGRGRPETAPALASNATAALDLPQGMADIDGGLGGGPSLMARTTPGAKKGLMGENGKGPRRRQLGGRAARAPPSGDRATRHLRNTATNDVDDAVAGRHRLGGAKRVVRATAPEGDGDDDGGDAFAGDHDDQSGSLSTRPPQRRRRGQGSRRRAEKENLLPSGVGSEGGEAPGVEDFAVEDLGGILHKADNELWSVRVECFETLAAMAAPGSHGQRVLHGTSFGRVLAVHMDRITDPHFKVVGAVLERCVLLAGFPKKKKKKKKKKAAIAAARARARARADMGLCLIGERSESGRWTCFCCFVQGRVVRRASKTLPC